MEKIFVTLERYKLLRQEVKDLKTKGRKAIADKLSQYRDSSDLLEDSSYTEVLQEQADLEEKIGEMEDVLENASIIRERKSVKVQIGSKVNMLDMHSRKKISVKIVGALDADPIRKEISNESPLGMALLGRRKNDIVEVEVPVGKQRYKIVEVK